jgi:hypothetical protein
MSLAVVQKKLKQAGIDGYTDDDIEFIYNLLDEFRPDILCEWGTNTGNSARIFYEATRDLNLVIPIHSTDVCDTVYILRPEDQGRQRGHHVKGLKVVLHVGDGATRTLLEVKRARALRPLVFIDGNHEEEEMFRDLNRISGGIPHALILAHDQHLLDDPAGIGYEAARFAAAHEDRYTVTAVQSDQCMVALWPLRSAPRDWV